MMFSSELNFQNNFFIEHLSRATFMHSCTAQKMKKSLMENFIFFAVMDAFMESIAKLMHNIGKH